MFIFYVNADQNTLLRFNTDTGAHDAILTNANAALPATAVNRALGAPMLLADGSLLVRHDTRDANQRGIRLPQSLTPTSAVEWVDAYATVSNNGFVDYYHASGVLDSSGDVWLDWTGYDTSPSSGPAYALTKWDTSGTRLAMAAECRAMFNAGGDGNLYMGAELGGSVHLSLSEDGYLWRARDSWDAIYRYALDGTSWQGAMDPLATVGASNVTLQDFAGYVPGVGVLTIVNSNDVSYYGGTDKTHWVRIFDPANIPWSDVPSTNGVLPADPTKDNTFWGAPVAEYSPWGTGGPDPSLGTSLFADISGLFNIVDKTLYYVTSSADTTVGFTVWAMDLTTGGISKFVDIPAISWDIDGNVVDYTSGSYWDDNHGIGVRGLLIATPVTGYITFYRAPRRLHPREDGHSIGAARLWPPPRTRRNFGGYY